MKMTKPYLDFGLQSDSKEAMKDFWGVKIGLDLHEVLSVYEGVDQYRYALRGAVLKLNMMSVPMDPARQTGYRRMTITGAQQKIVEELIDPDGNCFLMVPEGYLGEQEVGLEIAVSDLDDFRRFYGEALQLQPDGEDTFIWGKTRIQLRQSDDVATTADDHGAGFRYITFQVRDLDELHKQLVEAGVTEHMPPTQWSEVAYVSFIRDPDNNLIELSQRADLL